MRSSLVRGGWSELDRRAFLQRAGLASGAVLLGGLAGCSSGDDDGSTSTKRRNGSSATSTSVERTTTTVGAPKAPPLEEAFYAGVPLVVTMRTMQTFGNLVGVNKLFATRKLADDSSQFVVAPNHDTLYSIAVLDLDEGPQVLTLPDIPDRYHVLQILDAWMGVIGLLGTRTTGGKAGSWAVVRGEGGDTIPQGTHRLTSPTRHAFVLGRVRATEDDVEAAAKIAASITLTPLVDKDRPAPPTISKPAGRPDQVGTNGAAFYDELGDLLALDEPVTDAQRDALAAVEDLVGPGKHPTTEHPDRVPELEAAVKAGGDSLAKGLEGAPKPVNGWQVDTTLGNAGEEQTLRDRAVIARYFWGPVPAEEALYPRAVEASDGKPLDGSKRYRIHLDGDDLPPVDAFWSFTVYGSDLYLVPNEIDRFAISGDMPGLVKGDDGSIDIVLSADRPPEDEGNWLPTPDGPFNLIMRLYLPREELVEGRWEYPPIKVIS